jgi:hypothetical protein
MENNEIMNEGFKNVVKNVTANKVSGIGTGLTVLLTVIGTLAVGGGIGLAKAVWDKRKDNKELHQPDTEIDVEDEDVIEVAAK